MGNMFLATTSTKPSGGFNSLTLLFIVLVIAGFYLLMIRPQQRRRQQAQQRQNSVQPGARVRTTAGMYATVMDVDGDDVVLEVAPGVEVRYMKRAIMDVVGPADETVEDADETMSDSADSAEDDLSEQASADDDWTKVDEEDVAETGSTTKD